MPTPTQLTSIQVDSISQEPEKVIVTLKWKNPIDGSLQSWVSDGSGTYAQAIDDFTTDPTTSDLDFGPLLERS